MLSASRWRHGEAQTRRTCKVFFIRKRGCFWNQDCWSFTSVCLEETPYFSVGLFNTRAERDSPGVADDDDVGGAVSRHVAQHGRPRHTARRAVRRQHATGRELDDDDVLVTRDDQRRLKGKIHSTKTLNTI